MEIKLAVTVELGEKTLGILASLLSGKAPAAAPVVDIKATKKSKPADEKKDPPAANATTPPTEASADETFVAIKAKIVALRDAGKKEKTVELMKEYKLEKLSQLSEDLYTEFMEKLNAIK